MYRTTLVLLLTCVFECCEAGHNKYPRVVTPNAYPWVGWIRTADNTVRCGATLVAGNKAVSAASCNIDIINDVIVFGDHTRSNTDGREQVFTIDRLEVNSLFNQETFENDMVEIYLNRTVALNSYVQTIGLLPFALNNDTINTRRCRVMGWGYTNRGSNTQSDVLRFEKVELNECTGVPNSLKCFSQIYFRKNIACEGDIGGGYYCRKFGTWYLSGVITGLNFGNGCKNWRQRTFWQANL